LCVLDVGGRIQPYRALLGNSFVRYLAIDVRQTPLVDVVARGEHLPLASEQFDLVFCTQVLEYIPDPQLVINEIYRTLKTGGVLLLSAPAVFPRDSDVEYWRFLPCALRKLLSEFSHVDVTPEGNSLDGLIRTLNVCLVSLSPQPLGRMFRISMVPLLNLVAVLLQLIAPSRDDRFTVNFSAWAQK
jgi:SAM-dependent methyltransferase